MKVVQNIVVGVVTLLAAALGYQFITSSGYDARISRVDEKANSLAEVTERHDAEIGKAENRLDVVEERIEVLSKELDAAEERLKQSENRLREVEASGEQNERLLAELREGHLALKADYERRVQELVDLRRDLKKQDEINLEFDRRLRELERQAGVTPVTP